VEILGALGFAKSLAPQSDPPRRPHRRVSPRSRREGRTGGDSTVQKVVGEAAGHHVAAVKEAPSSAFRLGPVVRRAHEGSPTSTPARHLGLVLLPTRQPPISKGDSVRDG